MKKVMSKEQSQDQFYDVMLQTITAASQLPLVKINREDFLRGQFKDSEYLDIILEKGPQAVHTTKSLRKKADRIIDAMTSQTSLVSFAAGIPANPFTSVAAGTADIVQYFGFALNMAQQLAYLFGEDELFSGNSSELPGEAKMRIIAYLGIMFGASGSTTLLTKISKQAGQAMGKKIAAQALTKTAWYPLVKKVGAVIGQKITKKTVEKTVANAVPLLGGIISGGLTYLTFKPMGGKLADTFVKNLNGDFDDDLELNKMFREQSQANADIIDAEIIG